MGNSHPRNIHRQKGFSLLEIIVTLGLVGALATVVLSGFRLNRSSQMSSAIKDLSHQFRGAYDAAVFSGTLHRFVMNIKTGEYWVEKAPHSFEGRPRSSSLAEGGRTPSAQNSVIASEIESLVQNLERRLSGFNLVKKNIVSSQVRNWPQLVDYAPPTILLARFQSLKASSDWIPVENSLIFKGKLPSAIVCAHFSSELLLQPMHWEDALSKPDGDATNLVFIYFDAEGEVSATNIQLAVKGAQGTIPSKGPRFTMDINPTTGLSVVQEGFVDANFKS